MEARKRFVIVYVLLTVIIFGYGMSRDVRKMKNAADIPESITTPDKVKTRIGTLEFFDGIPTKKTAVMCYDNLDFLRGIEIFLNGIPAASLEAFRLGQESIGSRKSNQVLIFDELMDSSPLFLTGYRDGMAVFVMAESGLMVDFSLGGQKFKYAPIAF